MKKYCVIILGILLNVNIAFPQVKGDLKSKEKGIIEIVNLVLERYHYNPEIIKEKNQSEEIYKSFLKSLDPNKLYFLKSDMEEFSPYSKIISLQLKYRDLGFFNIVEQRYVKRQEIASNFFEEIVKKGFDIDKKEMWQDIDSLDYCQNEEELKERWRKFMKFRIVNLLYNRMEDENKKQGKDPNYKKKSKIELSNEIIKSEKEQQKELFSYLKELNRSDRFSLFVNSITETYDPHTNYMPPMEEKQFNIGISGKLEGIGAVLQRKDGYITVVEIVVGGPAWKQGELKKGDKILSAGNSEKELVNIVGMRIDHAIQYIRGKKNTKVLLSIKKDDGSIKNISITRDIVEIEAAYVKSAIIEKEGKKYGYIHLPSFYIDFRDSKSRNCATDVKEEIISLKKEGIEGLVLDLRGNGGGSLPSVVEMAGYFIKEGPIVQVRDLKKIKVLEDTDDDIYWDGKFIVMTDKGSASASEIFTAAMQDYKRAVIVGTESTYGKGTVQNVVSLDEILGRENEFGALKLTIQKYYRISGGSTQLKGVIPDIILPNLQDDRFGEASLENPMPWDEINKARIEEYKPSYDIQKITDNSYNRINNNEYFNLIRDKKIWIDKKNKENKNIEIGYNEFEERNKIIMNEEAKYKKIGEYKNNLKIGYTIKDLELVKKDSTLKNKREVWYKSLAKDIQLDETINILMDMNN